MGASQSSRAFGNAVGAASCGSAAGTKQASIASCHAVVAFRRGTSFASWRNRRLSLRAAGCALDHRPHSHRERILSPWPQPEQHQLRLRKSQHDRRKVMSKHQPLAPDSRQICTHAAWGHFRMISVAKGKAETPSVIRVSVRSYRVRTLAYLTSVCV